MQRTVPLTLLLVVLAGASTFGQDLVVDVNLTLLDVFIEDELGRPVLDLTADDFEVWDNGRLMPVKHLSLEAGPVAVGLLLDRSSSIRRVKNELDNAVMDLMESLRPDDPVFLMTFAGTRTLDVALTTTHEKVQKAIKKTKLEYGTRVHDAIVEGLRYLATSEHHRKVLIIFSDGADHYSAYSFDHVLNMAVFHGISVNVIGYPGDDSRATPEARWQQVQRQYESLASITAGKAFFPKSGANCLDIGRQILQRARYQYRVGFYSREPLSAWSNPEVRIRGDRAQQVTVRSLRQGASIISQVETTGGDDARNQSGGN